MKQTYPINGRAVRELRVNVLFATQKEIARQVGISPQRYSEIERGGQKVHVGTLRRLAEALGSTPDALRLDS